MFCRHGFVKPLQRSILLNVLKKLQLERLGTERGCVTQDFVNFCLRKPCADDCKKYYERVHYDGRQMNDTEFRFLFDFYSR